MTRTTLSQPPRIAVWLLNLFIPGEWNESIPGDLMEEFSELVELKSGAALARRWYWRQTAKTIVHLIGIQFRTAPWLIAGVVVGGILLVQLGHTCVEWAIRMQTELFNHHLIPHHPLSPALICFLMNSTMILSRLLMSALIGCVVALVSKRREMVATITLSLVCSVVAVNRFWAFLRGWDHIPLHVLRPVLVYFFGGLFAIVIGGGIVRKYRLSKHPTVSA